ncbi:MAG: hypothetical protein KME43_08345 [Myxacorys chilensis ATA2-1-KO14]|nr:hypothetical protein [Myxacorys chilensis ATA2-1-KO14]
MLLRAPTLARGEVTDQVEQGAFIEHPLSQNFQFVGVVINAAVGEFAFPLAGTAIGSREGTCTSRGATATGLL